MHRIVTRLALGSLALLVCLIWVLEAGSRPQAKA